MTPRLVSRLVELFLIGQLAGMSSGCARSSLLECQQLIVAIADGSTTAMKAQGSPQAFQEALKKTADVAAGVTLTSAELNSSRQAFVTGVRRASSQVDASTLRGARDQLVELTAKAVDAVSLRCSGER